MRITTIGALETFWKGLKERWKELGIRGWIETIKKLQNLPEYFEEPSQPDETYYHEDSTKSQLTDAGVKKS